MIIAIAIGCDVIKEMYNVGQGEIEKVGMKI